MPYATQAEMIERFGQDTLEQLTDRERVGSLDVAVLDRALEDADAIIDGYLKVRYTLPLPSTPPILQPIAADIAFYQLHPHGAPDQVRDRHTAAVRKLEALSKGTIKLDVDGAEPDAPGEKPQVEGPERTFSRDTLEGY